MSLDVSALKEVNITPNDINKQNVQFSDNKNTSISINSTLSSILHHPTQLYIGSIPTSSAVNAVIYQSQVSPTLLTSTSPSRLSVVSAMFKQWKGSIRLHIRFTKTVYVDFKILIAYVPSLTITDAGNMDLAQLVSQEYHTVVNVSNHETVDFDIPFISATNWLDRNVSSGVITIRIFSPIIASLTTVTSIPFSIDISASPSANLDPFALRYLTATSNITVEIPKAYDSVVSPDVPGSSDPLDYFDPAGANIRTALACDPSSFMACLNSTNPAPLYKFREYDVWDANTPIPKEFRRDATSKIFDRTNLLNLYTPHRAALENASVTYTFPGNGFEFTGHAGKPVYPIYSSSKTNGHDALVCIRVTDSIATPLHPVLNGTPNALKYVQLTIQYYIVGTYSLTASVYASLTLTSGNGSEFTLMPHTNSQSGLNGGSGMLSRLIVYPCAPGRSVATLIVDSPSFIGVTRAGAYITSAAATTNGLFSSTIIDYNIYGLRIWSVSESLQGVTPLIPKLRMECDQTPSSFPYIYINSSFGVQDTINYLNQWLNNNPNSENISFASDSENSQRPERRSTSTSFLSSLANIVCDVFLDNEVIGDILTVAGNVMTYFAPLLIFSEKYGSVYVNRKEPIPIALDDPNKLVQYKFNPDKTAIVNTKGVNTEETFNALSVIRKSQYNTISQYYLKINQTYTAPLLSGHIQYNALATNAMLTSIFYKK